MTRKLYAAITLLILLLAGCVPIQPPIPPPNPRPVPHASASPVKAVTILASNNTNLVTGTASATSAMANEVVWVVNSNNQVMDTLGANGTGCTTAGTNVQVGNGAGGCASLAGNTLAAHNFANSLSSAGVLSGAQPAFGDISGTVAASQLPNPTASTLGGIESIVVLANNWVDSISTSGVPHQSQPAFGNISGTITTAQLPSGGTANQIITSNGGSQATFQSQPVRLGPFIAGTPAAGAQIWAWPCSDNITFPANFAGSYPDANSNVICGTNNTSADTYTLKANSTQVGTVALSGPSPGAALVQQATPVTNTGTSSTISITPATSGHALILEWAILSNSALSPSVSDNNGGSWTQCGPITNANGTQIIIAYAPNHASGATTVTAGLSASEGNVLALQEFSGVLTSSVLDVCGATGATGNSNSPATGSNGATGNTNDLLIGASSNGGNVTVTAGPTNSFTGLTAGNYGGGSLFPAYEVVSATNTYSTGWTASASNQWAGNLLALKTNASVGACTPTFTSSTSNARCNSSGVCTCNAGQLFEIDSPATIQGEANLAWDIAGHTP